MPLRIASSLAAAETIVDHINTVVRDFVIVSHTMHPN